MDGNGTMIAVGGAIAVLGIATAVAQRRVFQQTAADASDAEAMDEHERQFLRRRARRRVQTSSLMTFLGLLVALHPFVIPEPNVAPRLFAAWWLSALLLAGWIVLMALFDIVATRAYARVAVARLHLRQRTLRERLQELQQRRDAKEDDESDDDFGAP